jgi:hypothetical protein
MSALMVPLVLLAPDALGSLALLVLLVSATGELVPLVLLAPDACGLLVSLVLLVGTVSACHGWVFYACRTFLSFLPLLSCNGFGIFVAILFALFNWCALHGRMVSLCCCCCVLLFGFLLLLLVVEKCLAFGVRMFSGGILHGSQ